MAWDFSRKRVKPEPERWLNVEIVFEESSSSFIWQETIEELQEIFQYQGAFHNVRQWILKSTNTRSIQLCQHRRRGKAQKSRSHKELIHPDGRGLVLVVSDCTSPLWYEAQIHPWLQDWSANQPTAILQLFPENMWEDTALGRGRKVWVKTLAAGVANQHLLVKDVPQWALPDAPERLILPVIMSDPASLQAWANVVAGSSLAETPAILLDLSFVNRQKAANTSEDEGLPPDITPEMRVNLFLATASFTAQKLAGMMAAAPVNLDVINLIRQTLLPEAKPVHVAEVYMGGLLQKIAGTAAAETTKYEFMPGVRKILNAETKNQHIEAVLEAISAHIAEKLGLSIRSFVALLTLLPQCSPETQNKILPFAHIAVEVLENLGGEYQTFAKKVADKLPSPSISEKKTDVDQPTLISYTEAYLIVLESENFSFTTAKLHRESSSQQWQIEYNTGEAEGIVEFLGEGIGLELIDIPAGNFLMGAQKGELESDESELPQREVSVQTFLMSRYPITQRQWRTVASWEPVGKELNSDPSSFKGDNRPVDSVSWYDAMEFCARLARKTGKPYRLPSEAEWEYACRAGTTTPFHFGETISTKIANYDGNYTYGGGEKGIYRRETTEVGQFPANAWGLHDLHGNVWEWCLDPWHDNYENAPKSGRVWDEQNKNENDYQNILENLGDLLKDDRWRVLRGGSWGPEPRNCRSAYRIAYNPDSALNHFGFRVVCAPPRTVSPSAL
jgi:formylglycine-generating enzyme required for sulfatase activity